MKIFKNFKVLLSFTLLFLCVFCLSITSLSTVIASINFYGAKNYLEQWEDSGNITKDDLTAAYLHAKNAKESHENHPLYTDTLSTILQYKALSKSDYNDSKQLLLEAEAENWNSAVNRPAWPVTWANIAYTRWLKGEVNTELTSYMKRASELGPHTPEVHIALAEIGLGMSKRYIRTFLNNKDIIKKHTLLGLRHPKTKSTIVNIVTNTKTQSLVCTWLTQEDATMSKRLKCA
ncbi:hypothetical protein JC525_10865 [Alteromonas sp. IB21]|uniref:VpsP family polysaccharide biosynthesis protein n=1 Tax=Alteromonas sp. IB21 TaxID=2779369 RepID=UPI0018E75DD7|nr:VpsP family polysaccharide biosynthesis protein [Alteromonas sp. IB21]MBJ2129443.1 hypothetical protein [Alteromonas sp. IB21]